MKPPKNNLCRAVSFEQRADTIGGDGFTLAGYAAVFNSPALIDSWEGTFNEQLARGAFRKTLAERKPVIQFDHGRDMATGSVPIAAPPTIREDKKGLYVESRMHDNARVEPIRQAIASGAIDGMSFRFRVTRDTWDPAEPDECEPGVIPMRTIQEVELFECGPVVFPAYDSTSVGVRSMLAEIPDADRARLVAELRAAVVAPDSDEDAGALAQAVDAILDEIEEALAESDIPTLAALLTGAQATIDTLLEILGVPDADDDPSETDEPAAGRSKNVGAGRKATPTKQHTDAGQEATSGATPAQRAALLRSLHLSRKDAA